MVMSIEIAFREFFRPFQDDLTWVFFQFYWQNIT